ncbi:hypothetical protein JCM11491_003080 [Sporobolomyces phaffii]
MACHSAPESSLPSTMRSKRSHRSHRADTASTSTFVLPSAPTPSSSTTPLPSTSRSRASASPPLPHEADTELDFDYDGDSQKPPNKNRKTGNPPRPPNAWICYRSARVRELKNTSQYTKMPQASISKLIGELWRSESPEVKRRYEAEATAKKLEHKEKYPGYSFRPVRREQLRKMKKAESDGSRKSRMNEMPSVLRPPPATIATGVPTPLSPPNSAKSQPSAALEPEYTYPPTPTSVTPQPFYPPAEYTASPLECPQPLPLPPIDTSQGWTMFQPVADCLPTPPVESYPRAASPPFYPSYVSPEYISPTYSMTASSSSSGSFDQPLPDQYSLYSSLYFSPVSSEGASLAGEAWGASTGSFDDYSNLYPQEDTFPSSHS